MDIFAYLRNNTYPGRGILLHAEHFPGCRLHGLRRRVSQRIPASQQQRRALSQCGDIVKVDDAFDASLQAFIKILGKSKRTVSAVFFARKKQEADIRSALDL